MRTLLFFCGFLLTFSSGHAQAWQVFTDDIMVHRDGAASAIISVHMVAGELRITGDGREVLEGEVRYSDPDWKPSLYSSINNERIYVKLRMPRQGHDLSMDDDDENKWTLALNPDLPVDLILNLGAGKADIDLAGLPLRSLNLRLGAGEFTIDLSNTSLPMLLLNAGVGQVTIRLGGEWKNGLKAKMNCGIGELNLYFPDDIPAFVRTSGILGEVNRQGFRREGQNFILEPEGTKGPVLKVLINGGIGQVNLRTG